MTLALKITVGRILAVPVFVLVVLYYTVGADRGDANEYLRFAAIVVFLAAALTDALDGCVARVRGEQTKAGTFLDPLADKALLISGLVLLSRPSSAIFHPHIPIWYTLMVISRDALLLLGSAVIHFVMGSVHVRPRIFGKLSTFFQMVIIVWVLLGLSEKAFQWLVYSAGAFTLASAALYFADGIRQLERSHAANNSGNQAR